MKRIFLLIVIALTLCGCSVREVVKNHYFTHTYVDSTYIDCTDTVFIVKTGDTVRITETKTRVEYRFRTICDTISRIDTLYVEKTKKAVGNGENGGFFRKFGVWSFIILIVIAIISFFCIFLRLKNTILTKIKKNGQQGN